MSDIQAVITELRTIDQMAEQLKVAADKQDWALVTKLGHAIQTAKTQQAKAAFEAKSAEREGICKKLMADIDNVVDKYIDAIKDATGGDYHIVYSLTPSDFAIKIMDLPKERKASTSTGTAEKYGVSTEDLIAKYGGDWAEKYADAEATDKSKAYEKDGKVIVPGNARYQVRKQLIKLDKGE